MSALDLLPAYVREEILTGLRDPSRNRIGSHGALRADLKAIPAAEAAGWTVTFRNDHWHNSATFSRGAHHVWDASTGWRAAELVDGRYSKPVVMGDGADGLRSALLAHREA